MRGLRTLLPLLALLPGTANASAATDNCAITPAAVIGYWLHETGPAAYEHFALLIEDGEQVLHSWLHNRPEFFSLGWTLDNCILNIDYTRYDLHSKQYRVLEATATTLQLESAEGTIHYQRIVD